MNPIAILAFIAGIGTSAPQPHVPKKKTANTIKETVTTNNDPVPGGLKRGGEASRKLPEPAKT